MTPSPAYKILQTAVRSHVDDLSIRKLSGISGIAVGRIRSVLAGRDAGISTIEGLCLALGLEFYIGPPRDPADLNNQPDYSDFAPILGLSPEASADEIAAAARSLAARSASGVEMREALDDFRNEMAAARADRDAMTLLSRQMAEMREALERAGISDESNVYALERQDEEIEASARPLDIVEVAAAAGDGSEVFDEEVSGRAWFHRDWLYRHSLEPAHCAIIHVRGESMEPTLPDGCSILVDRTRTRCQEGRIQVLRTDDGIVVKRLARGKDGWLLISDHPAWSPRPWDRDTVPLGEGPLDGAEPVTPEFNQPGRAVLVQR